TLSRPPAQITLREAFEVLEEGAAPWWCVGVEDPNCAYLPGCGIRPIWMAMKAAAEGVLERLTLHDMIYGHAPGAE
ncbi:MAG: Rrf2 family transcriptional regulator, partial [Armatimonadota bacterium]|nr:Rrf2 family transcriptional regulator [Armatimonadota bacterium]